MTDVLPRNRPYSSHDSGKGARTLGEALTRMSGKPLPAPVQPSPPAVPGSQGGADMGGRYELPVYGRPLPSWWPTLRRF